MDSVTKKKKTVINDIDEVETESVSDPFEESQPEIDQPLTEADQVELEESVEEPAEDEFQEELATEPESKEEQTNKPKSNKGLFMALAITLVVGGALTGGILYSRSAITNQDIRSKASQAVESPTPTPTPTAEVTPTPEEIDLSKYKLQVLNGSGIAGQAGAVDELLQAEGFAESDMDNADSYDYEKTEIQLKADTPKALYDTIERALNSDYTVTLGKALEDDSLFDAVIIVGQKI